MSTHRAVPSVLVAGALVLTGCGGDTAPPDTAADAAPAAAASADADVPADEVVGAIDREAEGGQRPESLPDDVPVPAGLTTVLSMGSDGRTETFTGNVVGATATEVRDGLADELEAGGWQVERLDDESGTLEEPIAASLQAEDGDRRYEATFVQIGEIVNCQLRFTGE